MKRNKLSIVLAILCASYINTQAQQNSQVWPTVTKEMKPWTRWWWLGSAVDEKNVDKAITQYKDAGFGGVEITPIYGAKGFEQKYLPFLSPEWLKMMKFSVDKASSLGMGVDLNLGTGWPYGGPQVKAENAATKMIVQKYQLDKGKKLSEKIVVTEPKQTTTEIQALRAINEKGEQIDILKHLANDGTLNWSPAVGNWEIVAFFSGKTRQMVKRAAPGGEGFTLDHLDKNSVNVYLDRFDKAFAKKDIGVRAFFNDSYEVYGANWTPMFFEAFKKLKGYDLTDYISTLTDKNATSEVAARVKSDYREVMSELLRLNFIKEWTDFSHGYKAISKNQAHGSPGNLIDLYATSDIAECETFGSSYFPIPGLRRESTDIRNVDPDPMMFKFATSATNTHGKKYTSSETFTWLTEHFKTSLSQAKPEVEQLFLSGVNHVFYHGTTYSPEEAGYPGWLFYASVNFTPSNSFWPHLNGLNDYITRVQSVLQTAKADNEILMYWPVYDVWHNPKNLDKALKVHDVDEWLHPTEFYKQSLNLSNKGYSFDFATDNILLNTKVKNGELSTNDNALNYKTLIVPTSNIIPVKTLERIIELAKNGATVIFEALPKDVEGLFNLEERRAQQKALLASLKFENKNGVQQSNLGAGKIILAQDLITALTQQNINRESLTDLGLKFTRRVDANTTYYYIVNHTAKDISDFVQINDKSSQVVILDPQNGNSGLAETASSNIGQKVRIQLKAGEAVVLKLENQKTDLVKWRYLGDSLADFPIVTAWDLTFENGGPELPAAKKLNKLVSWTELNDETANKYAGSGVYQTTFKFKANTANEYVLDLGRVAESARVWVNGNDLGIVWSHPFQLRIGKYLKKGKNHIKIEVNNLMANRIKDLDQKGVQWRNYHEINFVNIDYKDFNAKDWKLMPSGLIGPVVIKSFK